MKHNNKLQNIISIHRKVITYPHLKSHYNNYYIILTINQVNGMVMIPL